MTNTKPLAGCLACKQEGMCERCALKSEIGESINSLRASGADRIPGVPEGHLSIGRLREIANDLAWRL